MSDYAQTASQRWPGFEVIGTGRFAIPHDGKVHLFQTYAEARAMGVFHDVAVQDIAPPFVPDLADDWEDRQWERRR